MNKEGNIESIENKMITFRLFCPYTMKFYFVDAETKEDAISALAEDINVLPDLIW